MGVGPVTLEQVVLFALEILRRHHAHYVRIWSGLKMKPDRTFLLDEFPKAIAAFEARVTTPIDAPPPVK